MDIKLSICIPTFNRASYLAQLLECILAQKQDHIEVVISDNDSTDHTQEVVNSFKKHEVPIVYYKLEKNIGAERNFINVIDKANGEYCWYMGDDDLISKGGIKYVMEHLYSNNPEILLLNRKLCNIDMQDCVDQYWLTDKDNSQYIFKTDNDLVDYFNKCTSIGGAFSYISSLVFRRSSWNKYEVPSRYYGTGYPHVFVMHSIIKDGAILEYIAKHIILCRGDNDSFLSGDITKRIMLDFNGYEMIGADLYNDNKEIKVALLKILSNEHSIMRIIRLSNITNNNVWKELKVHLIRVYPKLLIAFLDKYRKSKMVYFFINLIDKTKYLRAKYIT